jgi:hypothetical protein
MAQENGSPMSTPSDEQSAQSREALSETGRLIASIVLIGAGALVEPELLAGALVGAGITYGLPIAGRILNVALTKALRLSYSAAGSVGDAVDQVRHQLEDVITGVQSTHQPPESES